jgi:hypothetical protein
MADVDLEQGQVGVRVRADHRLIGQASQDIGRESSALPDDAGLAFRHDHVGTGQHPARGYEEAGAGVLTADQDLDQATLEVGLERVL